MILQQKIQKARKKTWQIGIFVRSIGVVAIIIGYLVNIITPLAWDCDIGNYIVKKSSGSQSPYGQATACPPPIQVVWQAGTPKDIIIGVHYLGNANMECLGGAEAVVDSTISH